MHIQLFADDISLAPDTRLDGWEDAFQSVLDAMSAFALEWRFTFSLAAGKSAVMWFRRKDSLLFAPRSFILSGSPLLQVDRYKYLGVLLDEQLDWTAHYEKLLRTARFAAHQVCRMLP